MTVEARRDRVWSVIMAPPMDPDRRDYPAWVALGLECAADWGDPDYQRPIVPSRGFPTDAAEETISAWEEAVEDGSACGASWLTLAELLPHRARLDGIIGDVIDKMSQFVEPDETRLVVWFVP